MSQYSTLLDAVPVILQPADLARQMNGTQPVRILDVRTAGEFESGHIRGAYNVPLETLGEHAAEIASGVTGPLVLVCQSGSRARKAEEALRLSGLSVLRVLDGGMNGWIRAGLPIVETRKRVSLERQVRIVAGTLAALGGLLALAVNPLFALLSIFIGGGLAFAGISDTCTMAMLLAKLPYNRSASCDVGAMARALTSGATPGAAARN